MRIKVNSKLFLIIDILFAVISIILCITVSYSTTGFVIIAIVIILNSIELCLKQRNNGMLFLVLACITLINISLAVNDYINGGVMTPLWQINGLRTSSENLIGAKCMMLFTSVLSICFTGSSNEGNSTTHERILNRRENNKVIVQGGLIILNLILLYGIITIGRTFRVGSYTHVNGTIYEYSVVIFAVCFFFSDGNKVLDNLLLIYAVLYAIVFSVFGDRSSAFMYLMAVICLYLPQKLTPIRTFVFGIGGIILSNIISIFRGMGDRLSISYIVSSLLQKGLYQDTVSWAYYAGLSAIGLRSRTDSTIPFLWGFVLSIFGIDNEYASITSYAANNYRSELYNRGGGMMPAVFYSWAGWLGVVIGAIIVGLILRRTFEARGPYSALMSLTITLFVFRWYIYSPLNFFRASMLIPCILLAFCRIFNSQTKRRISQ